MAESDPQFDTRLAAIFRSEATGHAETMLADLLGVESAASPAEMAQAAQRLFRATHSLKGAARAVRKDDIEAVCHAMEGIFLALGRRGQAWPRALLDLLHEATVLIQHAAQDDAPADLGQRVAMLERLETWRVDLDDGASGRAAPEPMAAPPSAPIAQAPAAAPAETVRISVERLGKLLYQVEELVSIKLASQRHTQELDAAMQEFAALCARFRAAPVAADLATHARRLKGLKGAASRDTRSLSATVDSLLNDTKQALMLPVSSIVNFMAATVRELARSEGKEVELKVEGAELEIDRRLLDDLREVLVHLLRNAVGHGIELPRDRLQAGKSAQGTVTLSIRRKNAGVVTIFVADDGAGVDRGALADAGKAAGVFAASDAAAQDLLPLLFVPGVSTAGTLTAVSGRGIGLSIVQEKVETLGGTVAAQSTPGQGTKFTLALPVSLATFRAVEVRTHDRSFLLPIAHLVHCMRLPAGKVRMAGSQPTFALGEESIPLVSLARILELPGAQTRDPGEVVTCVVLESGGRRVGFAVDAVSGEQEVLSKPVDPRLTRGNAVAGAAVVASGKTLAILNAASLVRAAVAKGRDGHFAVTPTEARPPRAVLLAEDSITSRTLLKNILELAGHRVEVAVDGVQALQKLRAGRFDLLVSDIEMPGLDGFGLTMAVREDPLLAALPVILVTSLSSPADRARGVEVGANAYIAKSSFDQGDLLASIRRLL